MFLPWAVGLGVEWPFKLCRHLILCIVFTPSHVACHARSICPATAKIGCVTQNLNLLYCNGFTTRKKEEKSVVKGKQSEGQLDAVFGETLVL